MKLKFFKFHGAGNDFILIDNRTDFFSDDPAIIRRLCTRRFGVGADGLILLNQDPEADFYMKYYNADGSLAQMCGNGGRCVASFAYWLGGFGTKLRFKAADGMHTAEILKVEDKFFHVRLSLLDVEQIHIEKRDYLLNTGVPHFVRFLRNVPDEDLDVVSEGRSIRYNERFMPDGVNVNFVSEIFDGIYVRTYERGVEDETLSCGTGVTASAIAWALEQGLSQGPVKVTTRGGFLEVDFKLEGNRAEEVFLTGPVELVYEAETWI
ncbi:MAG: diaminopimelate epimerase [Bacteroidales bacterium]